jgi:hypothetical protein
VRQALDNAGYASEEDDGAPGSSQARPAQPVFEHAPQEKFSRLGRLVFNVWEELNELSKANK